MSDKIAVIGLGYVGLPLAIEFGKFFDTYGFDTNSERINDLLNGIDQTLEVDANEIKSSQKLKFTSISKDLHDCNIYIITVPTPIDHSKSPDLTFLSRASKTVATLLKKNDIVIYESTIFPGGTEEVCVPILEKHSGLEYNQDFFCGYSPERINPGDKNHRINNIVKLTSGSNQQVAKKIDNLYKKIIDVGTHMVSSIKAAEAAKIIENTQRDINIALVNELAMIFDKMELDTEEILTAAETKWNFLSFRPGLVGGHCIGVDPYYLAHKSIQLGHHPDLIMAGRKINDNMGFFVVSKVKLLMEQKKINVNNSNILIMGLTFKENCPDIRNSRVIDIYTELKTLNCNVDIFDPLVNKDIAQKEYGITPISTPETNKYDAIIIAVSHKNFKELSIEDIKLFGRDDFIIFDVKSLLDKEHVDGSL